MTASGPTDGLQTVSYCIDVTEVWAFVTERKVTIKDLTDAKDGPGREPKAGNTPPAKGSATGTPPTADRPPGGPPTADEERAAARLLQFVKDIRDAAGQEFYRTKLAHGTRARRPPEAQKL